jgi:5-formyltetrahydrofolate cyclo-ligase
MAFDFMTHLPEMTSASRVGLYAAKDGEMPTEPLFHWCVALGKTVAFPAMVGSTLEFRVIRNWKHLVIGRHGIPEPVWGWIVDPAQFDCLVVPGVAFDRWGRRLGRGSGYFDRTLVGAHRSRFMIGWAYSFQVIDEVPVGGHDVRMDAIITEQGVIRT